MSSLSVGTSHKSVFYVDRDDIRHHARSAGNMNAVHISWMAATEAGYQKLVAPTSLVASYAESVVASLIGLSLSGRLGEQRIRFANSVYAGDRLVVEASVSSHNADSGLICISVRARKEEGNEPVFSGTMWLTLKN